MQVPFRDNRPPTFITPPPAAGAAPNAANANGNASGSLREECVLRGLIDGEDEAATVAADARARHFTVERITAMLAAEAEYANTEEAAVLNAMQADGNDAAAANANATPLRGAGLFEHVDMDNLPPAPFVDGNVWHDARPDGSVHLLHLNAEQVHAYQMLQASGERQLLSFLSGPGGTGKSTLIRLLTAFWRSRGFNVLLCGTSGKAARLIGGHTVRFESASHSSVSELLLHQRSSAVSSAGALGVQAA